MRELASRIPGRAARRAVPDRGEVRGAGSNGEEARAHQLPDHLRDEGLDAVSEARQGRSSQLAAGLEHLLGDADALRCFRFMNEVMADQRVQSQVARRRAQHPGESIDEARDTVLAEDQAALVAHVPARVHPHAASAAHRPGRGEAVRGPGQGTAAVLPDRRRQDRGVPGPGRLRVRDPAAAGRAGHPGRPARRRRRGNRADAVHAAAADRAAVPARDRAGLRRGAGAAARRGDVGRRAVPDRAVGRDRRVAEAVRGGEGAAQAGREGGGGAG